MGLYGKIFMGKAKLTIFCQKTISDRKERQTDEQTDNSIEIIEWESMPPYIHTTIKTKCVQLIKTLLGTPGGGSDQKKALIVGQIRWRLSLHWLQSRPRLNIECLLGRIHPAGFGNKELVKKKERALIQDEKMRRDRNAQWVRNIEGVRTVRKGTIKTA